MEESLMTIEIRFSVISPEAGVQKGTGEFPPGMGAPSPSSSSFAKRLDTLENKTLYLVDTGFGGGYKFMLQLQKWFAEHIPSVTTIRKRKPGMSSWTMMISERNKKSCGCPGVAG
jgi:hypothetical protein